MAWWLFLDDERFPVSDGWLIARSFESARDLVLEKGLPEFISFDHDLGRESKTGSDFAQWLIDHMLDNGLRFPLKFSYQIHSQNPVGSVNINGKMEGAIKHIGWEG